MAFSYDLASADAQTVLISQVRLEIGDTVNGTGIKPDGSNLTDAEIGVWLSRTGDSVLGAAAAACQALSRMFAGRVDIENLGARRSNAQAAKAWAERAKELTQQAGTIGTPGFAIGAGRNDGYAVFEESDGEYNP